MEETEKLLAQFKRQNAENLAKLDELTDFVENASIPLHWVDSHGIIIWANQAELDTLGYSREDYIGMPIASFHADSGIIADILTRLSNNETLQNYPAKLLANDGTIRHVLISSNVLRKDGKFIHTRCFTKDVTSIVLEQHRKNDFVAMVSHELKTPLTSISAYVQLLLVKAREQENAFNIHALTKTDVQTRRMIAMISDFLTLARMEEGKMHIQTSTFDLQTLIGEISEEIQFLTKTHQIKIESLSSHLITADREKLGQVLNNLLSNAIKYSPTGAKVTIGYLKEKTRTKIYVSDEGIGISPLDQTKLFERFYRVNNDSTKTATGFGIGLFLCAEILRLHGSQIQVQSELGKGSTFFFYL